MTLWVLTSYVQRIRENTGIEPGNQQESYVILGLTQSHADILVPMYSPQSYKSVLLNKGPGTLEENMLPITNNPKSVINTSL